MGKNMALRTVCIVLFLLCASTLAAQEGTMSFSIGIVPLDIRLDTLSEMVGTIANRYGSQIFLDKDETTLLSDRLEKEAYLQRNRDLGKAYASHDQEKLQQVLDAEQPAIPLDFDSLPVTYHLEQFDQDLASALQASDDALAWYCSKNTYDALLLLDSEELAGFQRIRTQYYHPKLAEKKTLTDSLVQNSYFQPLEEPLEKALFALASKGNLGIVTLNDIPPGLAVSVDGKPTALLDTTLILSPGPHILGLNAPGYQPVEMEIESKADVIQPFQFSFEEVAFPSLVVHSETAKVHWFLDGNPLGEHLSISLSDPTYPMVLTLSGKGFAQRVVHLDSPSYNELAITLNAKELAYPSLRDDAQKDFYKRLRNTILWFGTYIGCAVLSQMYATDNPLWQVGLVGTSSLALVSSIAMAADFLSYESLAGAGI
ncbi:PEGA domain-containing protein [uncultured Sphaerochaeta sp.]|uniref:PEGA domain-containing protein n=1 Tax=uncultured Sphaerochaeta sp. TaxID=886478 RepID=UPI002A0A7CBD|nr:PEGA domain-containing protein [uncultured Sphaerochaeta sp.]